MVSPSIISSNYESIPGSISSNIRSIMVNPNPGGDTVEDDPEEYDTDYDISEFDSASYVNDTTPPSNVEREWVQLDTYRTTHE